MNLTINAGAVSVTHNFIVADVLGILLAVFLLALSYRILSGLLQVFFDRLEERAYQRYSANSGLAPSRIRSGVNGARRNGIQADHSDPTGFAEKY